MRVWRFALWHWLPREKSLSRPNSKIGEAFWGEGEFTEGTPAERAGVHLLLDIGATGIHESSTPKDRKGPQFTRGGDPSGRTTGLKFDAKGRFIACKARTPGGGGGRRIRHHEKGRRGEDARGTVPSTKSSNSGPTTSLSTGNGPRLLQRTRATFVEPRKRGTRSRIRLPRESRW